MYLYIDIGKPLLRPSFDWHILTMHIQYLQLFAQKSVEWEVGNTEMS